MIRGHRAARSLAAAVVLAAAGCRATVLRGLDEAQADQVVAALDAARVAATKARDASADDASAAYRVEVPAAEVSDALRALQARGLPRPAPSGLDALEQSLGLVATPEEERGRLARAAAGELARSLMRLPGVLDARVHLASSGPATALDRPAAPSTAGVLLLRAARSEAVDEARVRALVAASVPGLTPAAVTVMQSEAAPAAPSPPRMTAIGPFSVAAGSAPQLRAVLVAALLLNLVLAGLLIAAVVGKRRAANAAR